MGRETSGWQYLPDWFASEHTHKSANARSEGIPALRSIEAKAWQREKGDDVDELVEAVEVDERASPQEEAVAGREARTRCSVEQVLRRVVPRRRREGEGDCEA